MNSDLPRLITGPDLQLRVIQPHRTLPVQVSRCFPWTEPSRFLSLRDRDGQEIAFIDDPARLDPNSRAALDRALALSSFVFTIQRIHRVEQDIELRVWDVQTDRGPRRFQTELDHWPDPLPGGGWLLRDVTGDLYRFPQLQQMDRSSRRLFWAFQD